MTTVAEYYDAFSPGRWDCEKVKSNECNFCLTYGDIRTTNTPLPFTFILWDSSKRGMGTKNFGRELITEWFITKYATLNAYDIKICTRLNTDKSSIS